MSPEWPAAQIGLQSFKPECFSQLRQIVNIIKKKHSEEPQVLLGMRTASRTTIPECHVGLIFTAFAPVVLSFTTTTSHNTGQVKDPIKAKQ